MPFGKTKHKKNRLSDKIKAKGNILKKKNNNNNEDEMNESSNSFVIRR